MRLLICGDREWNDYNAILSVLRGYILNNNIEAIIEGEARGADSLARLVAQELKIEVKAFPAKWDEHGKAAGPIRNQQMLDEGKPNIVIAFHDNLTVSKGTLDMVTRAKKAGVRVIHYYHQLLSREIV